jgi:hypothetical protein
MKVIAFILAFFSLSFCFTAIVSWVFDANETLFDFIPNLYRGYVPFLVIPLAALLFSAAVNKIRPQLRTKEDVV